MRSRIMLVLATSAAIAWFGACSEPLPRGEDGVSAIQFGDIVVPSGMRLIDEAHQSHSVETAGWRQGRFIYGGLVDPAEVANYVRQRMPLHNWQLVHDETTSKQPITTTLRYTRGYYAAQYVVSRVEGRTQLVVDYDTDYTRR